MRGTSRLSLVLVIAAAAAACKSEETLDAGVAADAILSAPVDAAAPDATVIAGEDAAAPDATTPPPPPPVAPRGNGTLRVGDANGDGLVDVADAVALQDNVFRNGPAPVCEEAADWDANREIEAGDSYRINTFVVTGQQRQRGLPAGGCNGATRWPAGDAVPLALSLIAPARVTSGSFHAQLAITSPDRPVAGWSASVRATDCTIAAASTASTAAAEVWDRPAGLRHLGYSGTFATTGGAVTYVIMSQFEDVALPPSADATPVLELTVTAPIPASGCVSCQLAVGDGLRWRGQPITTVVAIGGRAYVPPLPTATVEICAP